MTEQEIIVKNNMTEQEIKVILCDIKIYYLELIDQSSYHREHASNHNKGDHYCLTVVTDDFLNLNRLQRHRLIYEKFGKTLNNQIHALSMKLYTVAEWDKITSK